MEKHWTNMCSNILLKCNTECECSCWMDYVIWSKDVTLLSFEEWKVLAKIEYEGTI